MKKDLRDLFIDGYPNLKRDLIKYVDVCDDHNVKQFVYG